MSKRRDKKEFDSFVKMAMKYDPNEDHRVVVFCEECDDITIISTKTGMKCKPHRPKWLDRLDEFLK